MYYAVDKRIICQLKIFIIFENLFGNSQESKSIYMWRKLYKE